MGRGRPPKPGTVEEKAAARRERVRNNVRALRERRKKEAAIVGQLTGTKSLVVEWFDDEDSTTQTEVDTPNSSTGVAGSRKSSDTSDFSLSSTTGHGGALYLVSRRNTAKTMFPSTIDTQSPYAAALLATVRGQFLPDSIYLPPAIGNTKGKPWESDQFLWTPCAFWVTSAFAKASCHETSLLKTSLLAIGMLLKGLEFQDSSLKIASLEMYRRSLQGIRKSLEPLTEPNPKKPKDAVALYLSCHAAAMFELIQNSDLSATMYHLRGVSHLICHLGDGGDEDHQSMAWLLLQDYRFAEMALCLKYRYTSFSSIKRRQFENANFGRFQLSKRSSAAHGRTSHNMLVTITDMADDICAIMVQLDCLRTQLSRPDAPIKIRRLLERLDLISIGFKYLHEQLVLRFGTNFLYKDTYGDGPAPGSVKFGTFDIGAAWCYYLMVQIYCFETSIDATALLLRICNDLNSMPSPPESKHSGQSDETNVESVDEFVSLDRLHELRKLHRSTCIQLSQCLQYFLQIDKGITGQGLAIFPLDAAIAMLEVEIERLQTDLRNAQEAAKDILYISRIRKDLAGVNDAREFCSKMQERAKQFGLPSFHSAGTADPAEKYQAPNTVRVAPSSGE